ncbi:MULTISPECIES: hypothetical protein [Lactococcus]|uniref:hypothetical protein n=1 Tax=Lactococcus TaxID=1357 RepID=UPI000CE4AB92|nr:MULTISPECIES: hypothetical protein [Lactococcus]MCD6633027.1 hypothetical protein [Lactococcus cremoris]PPA67848.1 hypothetical protein C3952_03985 [Lactococcus lactis]
MDFTHSKHNLDFLKDQVSVPFRYDYQYNNSDNLVNGEKGQISIFFNYENNSWKIIMIIQNEHNQSAAKPIYILEKDDGTFSFHGFWESISYKEVSKIICQNPKWLLTKFWEDFIYRMDSLTDSMVEQISKLTFDTSTNSAASEQFHRHKERISKSKSNELNIYPWYLKQTAKPIDDKRFNRLKSMFGWDVANWLRNEKLNLILTSDITRYHKITINDLERTL